MRSCIQIDHIMSNRIFRALKELLLAVLQMSLSRLHHCWVVDSSAATLLTKVYTCTAIEILFLEFLYTSAAASPNLCTSYPKFLQCLCSTVVFLTWSLLE